MGIEVAYATLANGQKTPIVVLGGAGSSSTPTNAAVSVAATSTALIAAADDDVLSRTTLIRNTGDRTVYVAFGEAATTGKFPLGVGETLKSESLLAINAITASGTGTAFVLSEAR